MAEEQVDQDYGGEVDTACIAQHEWYSGLRRAGFTRLEALYIVTRPSVEVARLGWHAQREDTDD